MPSLLSRLSGWALGRSAGSATDLARVDGPDLGPMLRSNFGGLESGPWHQVVKADWLGPFTPSRVPFWTLKLMREDPQLALGMGALKAPFHSIEYRLRGGDPAARAFLETAFHRTPLFDRTLAAILNSFDFGFQTAELIWELRDVVLEVDGITKGEMKSAYVIEDINDVDPERLSQIHVDSFGRMTGVSFDLTQDLPLDKILHAVHQLEFRNWWGRSQLRRAYNPFYWCNWLYMYLMRYMEQKGNPPLIGYAPPTNVYDASSNRSAQEGKDAVRLIAAQMTALRGGGAAGLPSVFDEKGNRMYSIEELKTSERGEQFLGAINHQQGMKLRAIGVPERTMTQDTQTGSYASVSEHVDMYFQTLEAHKRATVLPVLNHVAKLLVRANFKSTTSVPHFDASELSRVRQELVAKLIQSALGVPLSLEDGRSYTVAQLIDFENALEGLNVPLVKADKVAKHIAPGAPPAPGGPPAPLPPKAPGSGPPQKADQGQAPSTGTDLARVGPDRLPDVPGRQDLDDSTAERMDLDKVANLTRAVIEFARPAPRPGPSLGEVLEKQFSGARADMAKILEALARPMPAPVFNVPAATAPVVNVKVPTPVVNVEAPVVNLPAPVVNVTVEAPASKPRRAVINRDGEGRATSVDIKPES